MFIKKNGFKYLSGILLFIFVFMIGFVKMNIVYSSTGLGNNFKIQEYEIYDNNGIKIEDTLSNINDNAFIRIYEKNYGFDIVIKMFDNEKTFALKLPWKND